MPATLEVVKDGRVVAELTSTDYTIHFKQEGTTTTGELFLGQAAANAEAEFRSRQKHSTRPRRFSGRSRRGWTPWRKSTTGNRRVKRSRPPEPVRPEPIGIFSNGLNSGFPIDSIPDSTRSGCVVQTALSCPRATHDDHFRSSAYGTGYTIVPETRWTTPLESSAPSDIIFGAPDSALYLEPHLAREYLDATWAAAEPAAVIGGKWRMGVGQWREARRPPVGNRCR